MGQVIFLGTPKEPRIFPENYFSARQKNPVKGGIEKNVYPSGLRNHLYAPAPKPSSDVRSIDGLLCQYQSTNRKAFGS